MRRIEGRNFFAFYEEVGLEGFGGGNEGGGFEEAHVNCQWLIVNF
jgi:hypothetical protein